MQIGFFDSGIGGVSVLHKAIKMMPDEDYIYYADTMNVPYGPKPKDEVRKYVFDAAEFIMQHGVKALVIACNTATSVAVRDLRSKYSIPIIGMEPAVKPAVEKNRNKNKRILVTATALTLKEEKLKNLIARLNSSQNVDLLPLSELVLFAENLEFDEHAVIPYLEEQFSKYDLNDYDAIVLGCTHFLFYRDMIKKLFPPDVSIVDGNDGTVRNLKRTLEKSNALHEGSGKITFYNSGIKAEDKELDKFEKLFKRLEVIGG
jgi:glutamate racemase